MSFGKAYPGQKNPLDGTEAQQPFESMTSSEHGMFQYFLKVCLFALLLSNQSFKEARGGLEVCCVCCKTCFTQWQFLACFIHVLAIVLLVAEYRYFVTCWLLLLCAHVHMLY